MNKRCRWVILDNPLYVQYHDEEWGVEEHNDDKLFELLILESFQAGLSWECILNKREAFRDAFDNFDYKKIADYNDQKIQEILNNKGIVRNKSKVKAAINNAKVFIKIQDEYGSFNNYIWSFTNGEVVINYDDDIKTTSLLSEDISNDLKKHGMTFVGPTIIYSYLQAIGIINDHELCCSFRRV